MMNIKRNDRKPSLQATLRQADGSVVNLTSCTVRFLMRSASTGAVKVNAPAVIVNATGGVVRYDWLAADTDTAGSFQGEFEVTLPDAKLLTVPTVGYIPVNIHKDIA